MEKIQSQGFTLIELMVTVAIVAVLLAVGIPSLQEMSERGKLNAQLSNLVANIKMARSEAVSKSAPVIICASDDGSSCRSGNKVQWEKGWFMFLDRNRDGSYSAGSGHCADTEDCLLRYFPSIEDSNRTLVRSLSHVATFNADGTLSVTGGTNSGANKPLRVKICMPNADANNDEDRSAFVEVQPSGAIRTIRGTSTCP